MTNINTWIEPCLYPISETTPSGEFSLYSDRYHAIKIEMEKLCDRDYNLLQQLCFELLTNESKDLTIAAYYCFTLTVQSQVKGLIAGLQLITQLIEQYDSTLFPLKERARHSALNWLNQPALCHQLQKFDTLDTDQIQQVNEVINSLNVTIRSYWGESYPIITGLDAWLQEQATHVASKSLTKCQAPDTSPPQEQPSDIQATLKDDKQVNQTQKKIIQYWHQHNNLPLACQLARAWRWQAFTIPVHDHNKTPIQPPRKEAIHQLETLLNQQSGTALLKLSESILLEAVGCFWLDLQWYAFSGARFAGLQKLARFIRQQTNDLLQQYPLLTELQFNNGMSFVSEKTRQWLTDKPSDDKPMLTVDSIVKEASQEQQLSGALALINHQVDTQKPLEKSLSLQAQARLCLHHKRPDLAILFYQQLEDMIESTQMGLWYPETVLQLHQEMMHFINGKGKQVIQQASHEQWVHRLKQTICQQNPIMASLWF